MTYGRLKSLVSALLISDNNLTKLNNEVLALLEYAYTRIAMEADALKLLTANSSEDIIIRNGPGNLFVRMPKLPESDDEELDIDEELCFAAARFIASFVSKLRPDLHEREARKIINAYNQKVSQFLEKLDQEGVLDIYENDDMYGKRTYP